MGLIFWIRGDKKKPAQEKPVSQKAVTPGGLTVLASSSKEKSPLPVPTDECKIMEASFDTYDYPCGHSGPDWFVATTYGLTTKKLEKINKCPQCFLEEAKKRIIRCAKCQLPILPGSAVALYSIKYSKGLFLDIATKADEESVMGCMRRGCVPSGGFFAGHWDGEKFVSAFASLTMAEEAFHTGKVVIAGT